MKKADWSVKIASKYIQSGLSSFLLRSGAFGQIKNWILLNQITIEEVENIFDSSFLLG